MKLRAVIVDDEALARERLRKMLATEPEFEIVAECANGPEAITAIQQHRPELMFLDVQMPEVSGFDVLRALPETLWPVVIFVTAHDEHAVQAFEIHALDYLLKPFTQARLRAAVDRARQQLEARNLTSLNRQLASWLKAAGPEPAFISRIALKEGNQTLFKKVEDIDFIESAANYAVIKIGNQSHILRETLTNLENRLPPRLFARISRSVIVNLDRVKGVQSGPKGDYTVLLHNGQQLLLTRNVREIQEKLQYAGSPGKETGS